MIKEHLSRAREIVNTLGEDDHDKIEILENETDIFKLIDWGIKKDLEILAEISTLKYIEDKYSSRRKSKEKAQLNMRDLIKTMLESAGEDKYKTALATVTIRDLDDKITVTDVSLLPVNCREPFYKPINKEIKNAVEKGFDVKGVEILKNRKSIAIRR